jgi:4'-phosphopantetheinyl transferase
MIITPSDICIYICRDDHTCDSDTRICRFTSKFISASNSGADMNNITPAAIIRPAEGRPHFIPDNLPFFSVSHSGIYWACAVSYRCVGLDIQAVACRRNTAAIARRFFHPDEAVFLSRNGPKYFFAIWAAKESYVKFTGAGIDDNFARFSVVSGQSLADNINGVRLRRVDFYSGYAMCVSYDGCGEANIYIINEMNG